MWATSESTFILNPCFSRILDSLSLSFEPINSWNPSVSMELPISDYRISANTSLPSTSCLEFFQDSYEEGKKLHLSCKIYTVKYYHFWGSWLVALFTPTHPLSKEPVWILLKNESKKSLPFVSNSSFWNKGHTALFLKRQIHPSLNSKNPVDLVFTFGIISDFKKVYSFHLDYLWIML